MRRAVNSLTGAMLGPSKLHLDIVDYPGEWLVDLGLMDLDFAAWSRQALAQARGGRHRGTAAQGFLGVSR